MNIPATLVLICRRPSVHLWRVLLSTTSLLAFACSGSIEEASSGAQDANRDGGDTAPDVDAKAPTGDGVACVIARCAPGEVCATYDGAAKPADCFNKGTEPSFDSPRPPAALLFCDDDGDCNVGLRCVVTEGEIFRAECKAESGDCGSHSRHICSQDQDCHACGTPAITCKPVLGVSGADRLKRCSF